MIVTLIRHLPTKWNLDGKLQGKKDIPILPITPVIDREIEQNLQHIRSLSTPELVLASTLQRTQQTAKAYGYVAKVEPLLDELDFGSFEGRLKQELIEACGNQWFVNPKQSLLSTQIIHLEKQIHSFLEKYSIEQHLLVFGHGSWIRAFVSILETGNIHSMNKRQLKNNACFSLFLTKNGNHYRIKERINILS